MARIRRASLLVATTSLFVAVASTMPIPTQNCAKCSMAGTKANGRRPWLFLPLRGGAVIVEDARGMCPETGPWLEEFDMPHEQAQNLSVVLPRDTHSLALGASAFRMCKDCQGFRGMLSEQGQHLENEFLAEDPWLQRQPIVKWDAAWGKCTLLMLDPDAPQPRSQLGAAETGALGPWLHWLVVDAVGAPENGDTLVEHMGPSPPKGRHRYIFLLFRQGGCEVKVTSRERSKWDFAGFLRENKGLELVAANHYTATV